MTSDLSSLANLLPRPAGASNILHHRIHLPGILITFLFSLWFLFRIIDFGIDDSFITYRYAQNIVLGNGPVFNVGERYLGTTAPGFAILLACLSWVISAFQTSGPGPAWLDIPHLARYISAISACAIGLVLYAFLSKSFSSWRGRLSGILLAGYVITLPQIAYTAGHETLLSIALVLIGLFTWPVHLKTASLVLGIATLVRPDAALAFVAAVTTSALGPVIDYKFAPEFKRRLSWHWPTPSKLRPDGTISFQSGVGATTSEIVSLSPAFFRRALRTAVDLLPFLAPLAAWGTFALLYYGSPLPGTLLAKRAETFLGIYTVVSVNGLAQSVLDTTSRMTTPFALGAVCGLACTLIRRSRLTSVVLWSFLYLAFYSLIGTTFSYWYATPLVVAYLLIASFGLLAVLDSVWTGLAQFEYHKYLNKILVPLALGVFLLAAALEFGRAIQLPPYYNPHIYSFDQVVSYLHRESPSGASVSAPEPGSLGYLLGPQYYVIDTLGLVSPGVSEHILRGESREWPYVHYRPDWVLVSYSELAPDLNSEWFTASYAEAAEFQNSFWSSMGITLRIYRRMRP